MLVSVVKAPIRNTILILILILIQPQENLQNVPCFARDRNEVVGGEDFRVNLPKLKVPQRGEPISQSLAEFINAACTSQCD